ncbi:hypothetical protein [Streptomyces sp. NPDC094149]|uniref:hypothetical protein n=1 Tax=Streptomyces sp. NPDC094149 TaxID=3155079 RepID=UPI00331A37B5
MKIELNHTVVYEKSRWAASRDVAEVLGLPEARAYGPSSEGDITSPSAPDTTAG